MSSNGDEELLERPQDHRIVRASVPELDDILGRRLQVLDDGFVRVIDYMGNDNSVVQAARVSYGEGTRKVHEDQGLIRYLMRHRHTTPFEMCEIKLHVRAPMDTWRQWIRHRTANVNEYSTRYSIAIDSTQKTPPSKWRLQAKGNRQGSEGFCNEKDGTLLTAREAELQKLSRDVYQDRLDKGVAREQARKDLPLSTYTEAYWKIDLHNILHFLSLRMDDHAQEEIRAYASVIGHQVVALWVPLVWQAFLDYNLHAVRFSAVELAIMRLVLTGDLKAATQEARKLGWLDHDKKSRALKRNRERDEFIQKARKSLGLEVKWLDS